jgi:hypothetical protein
LRNKPEKCIPWLTFIVPKSINTAVILKQENKNMKKTNEFRKLNLKKKVIVLLNEKQKGSILGGTLTDPITDETRVSCDPGATCQCTRSTIPGTACPTYTCTTVPTR